jgi:hypothetical protein
MVNQTLLPPADSLERYLAMRACIQALPRSASSLVCTRADIVWFVDSSLPVYAVGNNRVLKLYPGAFQDSYQIEHRVLQAIHRRLPIPTLGEEHASQFEGWGYLLMGAWMANPSPPSGLSCQPCIAADWPPSSARHWRPYTPSVLRSWTRLAV